VNKRACNLESGRECYTPLRSCAPVIRENEIAPDNKISLFIITSFAKIPFAIFDFLIKPI